MNINATILGQIISFIFFVWFCMKYVWVPLISIIERRQKEISDSLAEANYAKLESDRANTEALKCLEQARVQAKDIIKQANQYKTQIINEAKCEANQERERILSQTRVEISYEKNRIMNELTQIVGQLIVQSTEKIIEHSINDIVDQHIVNNIINNMLISEKHND